jgi:hypothetical protein
VAQQLSGWDAVGSVGQLDAPISRLHWTVRRVAGLGRRDGRRTRARRPLRDHGPAGARAPEWINAAAQSVANAYDEDGELVDDDAPARLSLRSLQTYLQRLGTIFETLGCDVAKATLVRLLDDPKLKGLDGMTPANIAFCRAIVKSPAKQAILFGMP